MTEYIDHIINQVDSVFTLDMYDSYINGEITFTKIASLCGVPSYKLRKYFKAKGLKVRQYVLDDTTSHDFFMSIDSEIKAYLLGFYLADGSLDSERNRITISISECDEYVVDLFRQFISPHYKKVHTKSFFNKKTGYTSKPMFLVSIKSRLLCESLEMYGMGKDKTHSHNIDIDIIPDDCFIHFIRGYFDGDGTVYHLNGVSKRSNGREYPYDNYNWSIISNTNEHLLNIKKRLMSLYGIYANIINDGRGHFLLEINRKVDFFKMRDVLYRNANFFLSRKKDKYMAIPC